MSRVCAISGKKPSFGHRVSHSKRRTNRMFKPNVHDKRLYAPELGRMVRIRLSNHALRTIDKMGLAAYLRAEGLELRYVI